MRDPVVVAHDAIENRDVEWVEGMVRLNLCDDCNESMIFDPVHGQMNIHPHCGHRIISLWRLAVFTVSVDPDTLLCYYDEEDLS